VSSYSESWHVRWESDLAARRAAGQFGLAATLVGAQQERFLNAIRRLNERLESGALHEVYGIFAGFFGGAMLDFGKAAELGLVSQNQARFLQNVLLNALDPIDEFHGGTLGARVRRDCADLLTKSPQPRPSFEDELRVVVAQVVVTTSTMDAVVYSLLAGEDAPGS